MPKPFKLQIKRERLTPFSSAAISSLLPAVGSAILAKIIWTMPNGRVWTIAGAAVVAILVGAQLWRLHALYEDVKQSTLQEQPMLRKCLNEAVRTFSWENALFALLALAVFQFYLAR